MAINPADKIPKQRTGAQSNTIAEKTLPSESAAKKFFAVAASRLADINSWQKFAGNFKAEFCLFDAHGKPKKSPPQLNDHFRIDGPGPGSISGKGYDWVRVEHMEKTSDGDKEVFLIRVRPTANPLTNEEAVAHFFTDGSTSTFMVSRNASRVAAEVHGRNELPNIKESGNLFDKARNAIAGTVAVAFYSKFQWQALVDGVMDFEL